jgi:hypothetical protein
MRHPDAGIGVNPYSGNAIYLAFGHRLHETPFGLRRPLHQFWSHEARCAESSWY